MRKPVLATIYAQIFLTSAFSAEVNDYIPSRTVHERIADDTVTSVLQEIEVTADRNRQGLESPTPLQKIDSRKIRESGITDISDAMRRLPGVNLRDYGGAGGLKTISVRGLGTQHTSVIYDGAALSDCQSGQIDLARYSLDNVRSLTLHYGDNDDIFIPARMAASASSLVISSFTTPQESDDDLHLKGQFKTGSFGLYNPFLRIEKNFINGFSVSGNANFIHADNNYPFTVFNGTATVREKRENSRLNSLTAEINAAKRWHGKELTAKLYYYDTSNQLPGPVIYYVNESNEHLKEKNFFGQARFRGKLNSSLSLLSILKFNWASSRFTDTDGKYPGGRLDNHYIQRETYASASLLYVPSRNVSLDYSADWAWNNLTSNTRNAIRPYRNSILQTVTAKYSNGRVTALARLLYSVYVNRAKDGEAGKDKQRLSPSFSVSAKPFERPELYFRASYKNIFRMPTFNEAYYDNNGSINLDAETTDQLNIGVSYLAPPMNTLTELSFTADAYLNNVRNKIVAVPYNLFLWTMSNLGKVRVYGLDVTLGCTFSLGKSNSLLFSGSYSYQRAQIRTSPESADWMRQVAYIPLNSGSFSLSWLNPWVNAAVHSTATGPRYTTNYNIPETRIPGFIDTGISLFRSFTAGKARIEGKAEILNLFNRQYEIIARYPMPGRSWRLTLEVEL